MKYCLFILLSFFALAASQVEQVSAQDKAEKIPEGAKLFIAPMERDLHHSGDSDSPGAITGNLLGLMLGAGAIPEKWMAELELRAEIETVARDLFKQFEDTDAWPRCYPGT